mgnify:CR=1 FL=1
MKNILYQLGDTAANLDGSTPAQTGAIGMNPKPKRLMTILEKLFI